MATSKVRILVLSDTHDTAFPSPSTLPPADVILHCGNMTTKDGLSNYKSALEALSAYDAELKLVIPGNHDVSLDPVWWKHNLEENEDEDDPTKAKAIFSNYHTVHLLDEGLHTFVLQDGRSFTIYASPYTPDFNGNAFTYGPEEDRFNPAPSSAGAEHQHHPIPEGVDVVVTHGPPLVPHAAYLLDKSRDGELLGCAKLWAAIRRTRPRLHCFGHVHEGYGVQCVRWAGEGEGFDLEDVEVGAGEAVDAGDEGKTVLVNAAVMDQGGDGNRRPLVVDLKVSRAGVTLGS
ncbi:ser thr protein phosphatase family protein [Colletotrichum karsti]|uniref:Ser thr protein phosphatase family protein n=1 Tax=Colletotrichum karsti TaxID=1095194 RepID=A0A9P6I0C1_9PEZI|nr:ser thr protein phosphatase family protein [Colletotrichum karsti]KAF9873457.1 ser thr protein phosphatase family protein [Colletotrichum karsti]